MEHRVTDLKRVGKSDIYKMFLDYMYCCDLEMEVIYKFHIKEGILLSDVELDEIKFENQKLTCYSVALKYVSKCLKTQKQIYDYLLRKGYLIDIINLALQKLSEYGYVDDKMYAENYLMTYKKQKGARLIKKELADKGVDRELLDQVCYNDDELENLIEILQKRLKNIEFPIDFKQKQKIIRYLLSKGFQFDDIKKAMNMCKIDYDEY